jgi:hypothetical protein
MFMSYRLLVCVMRCVLQVCRHLVEYVSTV